MTKLHSNTHRSQHWNVTQNIDEDSGLAFLIHEHNVPKVATRTTGNRLLTKGIFYRRKYLGFSHVLLMLHFDCLLKRWMNHAHIEPKLMSERFMTQKLSKFEIHNISRKEKIQDIILVQKLQE